MKALLLAAGFGHRLRPLTDKLPKCLMPVKGVPLIDYWISALTYAGVDSILVNLHHHATIVNNYLARSKPEIEIQTVFEPVLLNTAGTLLSNREFFEKDALMLIHADNLCICDFNEFIDAHSQRPAGTEITMMTYDTATPESCGIVDLDVN